MPPPMITCGLCNAQVSKRQSLLIEPFGRICRSHPEVNEKRVKDLEMKEKAKMDAMLVKASNSIGVISLVEQIRMMAFINGVNPNFIMFIFGHRIPRDLRADVEAQLKARGPLTQKEMDEAIFGAAMLMQKGMLQKTA